MRDVTKNLLEAKSWAEEVRDCLSKVEKWSTHRSCDTEKAKWEHVDNLLRRDPVPCNEPALVQLKVQDSLRTGIEIGMHVLSFPI